MKARSLHVVRDGELSRAGLVLDLGRHWGKFDTISASCEARFDYAASGEVLSVDVFDVSEDLENVFLPYVAKRKKDVIAHAILFDWEARWLYLHNDEGRCATALCGPASLRIWCGAGDLHRVSVHLVDRGSDPM